jgi:MFS transporter, DHA1 family, tetracycline resistance protein
LLLGTLALFVVSLGYGVVVPLLPELAGGRAATDEALLSAVYASYAVAKIGAQVPGGVWVDRAGPEKVMRLALVGYFVSTAGFLVGDLAWFTAVRALEGAATGLAYPAAFALALRGADPSTHGRRLGLLAGLGTSGLLVGPALGGWLGEPDPTLPVYVALGLTLPVIVWSFARRTAPRAAAPVRTVRAELRSLTGLALNLAFVGLMLPIAFNKLTFSAFQGLLPLVGPDQLGVGSGGVTTLFIITGVCFGVAQPIAGWLADRVGPRAVVLGGGPFLIVALGLQTWATALIPYAVYYGLYVVLASLMFTATMKHAATAFGTDDTYGGLFGMLGTLTDLMTIVGPLLFLNLYATVGPSVALYMGAAGIPFFLGYGWLTRRSA